MWLQSIEYINNACRDECAHIFKTKAPSIASDICVKGTAANWQTYQLFYVLRIQNIHIYLLAERASIHSNNLRGFDKVLYFVCSE